MSNRRRENKDPRKEVEAHYKDFTTTSEDNLNVYDKEEIDALEWKQSTHKSPKKERIIDNSSPVSIPDEVWMIPPHCSPVEILGDKKFHLNRIAQLTSLIFKSSYTMRGLSDLKYYL
ncbi:hypothetical protein C1645_838294 [Glomus cerebriforme]|uniref:Uncharacterized protein n=1 Tax=Glomus cerebriforme TaxID=658196 RepID=A0A397S8N4_9GLOM|nr:hypothetical protein C1645_838294 [Glomus cerebriforme]